MHERFAVAAFAGVEKPAEKSRRVPFGSHVAHQGLAFGGAHGGQAAADAAARQRTPQGAERIERLASQLRRVVPGDDPQQLPLGLLDAELPHDAQPHDPQVAAG